jgi:FtsP/CotA-like multicopper oxidase with cupredoxin domain
MKKQQRTFKLNPLAAAVMMATASTVAFSPAFANGGGVGLAADGSPVQTYYANTYVSNADGKDGTANAVRGLRKFIDTLPGVALPGGTGVAGSSLLSGVNNLGQYLPTAVPDTSSYFNSDYYEIAVVEYAEKMHTDLAKPTTLRGYVQIDRALTNSATVDPVAVAAYNQYVVAKAAYDAKLAAYQAYQTAAAAYAAASPGLAGAQTTYTSAWTTYNAAVVALNTWTTQNNASVAAVAGQSSAQALLGNCAFLITNGYGSLCSSMAGWPAGTVLSYSSTITTPGTLPAGGTWSLTGPGFTYSYVNASVTPNATVTAAYGFNGAAVTPTLVLPTAPGAQPALPGLPPTVPTYSFLDPVSNANVTAAYVANLITGVLSNPVNPAVVANPGTAPTPVAPPAAVAGTPSTATVAGLAATSKAIPLTYPDGSPIMVYKENADHSLVQPLTKVQAYGWDKPHYLGPVIVASKGRAVRIKYVNALPAGRAVTNPDGSVSRNGDLFLPVDETITGAGFGPDGVTKYPQSRQALHWHGGDTPWISDGTPHQWIVPADDELSLPTDYKRGVSQANVTDMPDPGPGAETLYWPNNMSNRLMFYHDHALGITRLNVYGGTAAGYVLTDKVEDALTKTAGTGTQLSGVDTIDGLLHNVLGAGLPSLLDEIPLVIQDKTFVPHDIAQQDALWDEKHWGTEGDLWFPHVYEINQNPSMVGNGTNPVGRWDYGPWFWPVFPAPLQLPTGAYGDVSTTPEGFMDTPLVNGTAYPKITVDPKAYRLRILNAGNDRFLNLSFFVADPTATTADGRTNTEVKMVPFISPNGVTSVTYACPDGATVGQRVGDKNANGTVLAPGWTESGPTAAGNVLYPNSFPCAGGLQGTGWGSADNRPGGVPFPGAPNPDGSFNKDFSGPHFVQIGTEGGLLPNPVDIPPNPVNYEYNKRSVTVMNVLEHGLFLGNAERADTVVDFSAYAGKTLILYNDSPAPLPAGDPRIDYYTDGGDQTGAGGAPNTLAGFGPNTRTVMQFNVSNVTPVPFNAGAPATTNSAGGTSPATGLYAALPTAYAASQEKPFVTESAYNNAFGTKNADSYGTIFAGSSIQPNFVFTPTTVNAQTLQSISLTGQGVGYTVAPNVELSGGGLAATITILPSATAGAQIAGGKVTSIILPPGIIPSTATLITAPTVKIVSNAPTPGGIAVGQGASAVAFTDQTVSAPAQMKAIQELFDPSYGRMNATLGVELPFTSPLNQTTIPLGYIDPTTEDIPENQIQIWKITHNGVDTHPVHFHLFNLQVINRVGWDGTIKPPYDNEQGWKETLKMNPLEDVYVAVRPRTPEIPFGVKDSVRLMDPSQPAGAITGFTQIDPKTGVAPINPATGLAVQITNQSKSYGWEYVWHCHILGHEENDFMRPINFAYATVLPAAPTVVTATGTLSTTLSMPVTVTWTDPTPFNAASTLGNKQNEIGFIVQRAAIGSTNWAEAGRTLSNATKFVDTAPATTGGYQYRVIAYNQSGSSPASAPGSIGTAVATTAPRAPSAVLETANSATQVTVTWTDNSGTGTAAPAETGFIVQRATVTGGTPSAYAVVGTAPAHTGTGTGASFIDTTALPSTTYRYSVIATNNGANSAAVAAAANVTTQSGTAAVSGVTTLTATANSATQVTLRFRDNATNETGFLIERAVGTTGTLSYATLATAPLNVGTGTISYVDTTATPSTAYTYRVTAVNTTTLATAKPTATVTTPALPNLNAPSNVTVQMTGANTATINFNDLAGSETLYLVQVSTDSGKSWGDGTITSFTQAAPAFVATRAGAVTGTGGAVSISVPNARNAANLTFTSGATPYLFRVAAAIGTTSNGVFNDVAAGTTTNYTGVTTATVIGNWGNIAVLDLSGQTVVAAPSAVTATAGVASATLAWSDNANNNASYAVQYSTNGGTTWTNVGTGATGVTTNAVVGGAATSATVNGLTFGTSYLFRLQAVSAGTNRSSYGVSNAVTPLAPPAPATPSNPGSTRGSGGNPITASLSWTAPAYATSYNVVWSTSATALNAVTGKTTPASSGVNGGVNVITAIPVGTSYTFTAPGSTTTTAGTIATGTTVNFKIQAVNSAGNSNWSTAFSSTVR